jgi:hypothetical protein
VNFFLDIKKKKNKKKKQKKKMISFTRAIKEKISLQFIGGVLFILFLAVSYQLSTSWKNGTSIRNTLSLKRYWSKSSKYIPDLLETYKKNNNKKFIHKITEYDIETYIFNESNPIIDRMIDKIKLTHAAVSYPDEEKEGKLYSLILIRLANESEFLMNWHSSKKFIYLLNPCIYFPSGEDIPKKLKVKEEYLGDDYFHGQHTKKYYKTVTVITDLIGRKGKTLISHILIVLWDEQAAAIQSIFNQHVKGKYCFYDQ